MLRDPTFSGAAVLPRRPRLLPKPPRTASGKAARNLSELRAAAQELTAA